MANFRVLLALNHLPANTPWNPVLYDRMVYCEAMCMDCVPNKWCPVEATE